MTDPNIPNDPERGEPSRPEPPLGDGPGVSYPPAPPVPPAAPVPPAPGADVPYGQPYAGGAVRKSPVLSILSLIAGIVGLIGSWIVIFPIVGSILDLFIPAAAVVLGFLGRRKEPTARGMWLTGIILGFVALAIAIIALILWIVLIANANASGAFNGNNY
jgi:hypothetical protein